MTTLALRRAAKFFSAIALAAALPGAWAQASYPNQPVHLIVPWPAGGSVDLATRIVAERLSKRLGQQVIVDNKPGAGGNIGAAAAAKAAPDGYTLLVATTPMIINRSLYANLPFDTARDFVPVSTLVNLNYVLVANPKVAGSVADLVAQAKAKPGRISYASSGPGTQLHLLGETFKKQAGIDVVHVPYKGAPPALLDMLGGEVQMMFPGYPVVKPMLESGQLKPLAVVGKHRLASLPNVPTMAEAGYPGIDSVEWYGVVAPAKTPEAIVSRLNKDIVAILDMPDVRKMLSEKGFEPVSSTPQQFGAQIASEQVKWANVVKQINLHLD
jgi:tripartite-type tricarboxylate transporter receptor subunit TctC